MVLGHLVQAKKEKLVNLEVLNQAVGLVQEKGENTKWEAGSHHKDADKVEALSPSVAEITRLKCKGPTFSKGRKM